MLLTSNPENLPLQTLAAIDQVLDSFKRLPAKHDDPNALQRYDRVDTAVKRLSYSGWPSPGQPFRVVYETMSYELVHLVSPLYTLTLSGQTDFLQWQLARNPAILSSIEARSLLAECLLTALFVDPDTFHNDVSQIARLVIPILGASSVIVSEKWPQFMFSVVWSQHWMDWWNCQSSCPEIERVLEVFIRLGNARDIFQVLFRYNITPPNMIKLGFRLRTEGIDSDNGDHNCLEPRMLECAFAQRMLKSKKQVFRADEVIALMQLENKDEMLKILASKAATLPPEFLLRDDNYEPTDQSTPISLDDSSDGDIESWSDHGSEPITEDSCEVSECTEDSLLRSTPKWRPWGSIVMSLLGQPP